MDNDNTILSAATCDACIEVVKAYQNDADQLMTRLENLMNSLTAENYIGDASDGYMDFYRNKVCPIIRENLYGEESLTAGMIKMLNNIKETLLNQTDPSIGKANREM